MTRLTEALERARSAGVSVPVGAATPAAPEVPTDWQFEPAVGEEPEVPAEPDLVDTWTSPEPALPQMMPAPSPEIRSIPATVMHKLVLSGQTDTVLVEQYRRLAAVLHHAQTERQIRTVMVASAVPSEGKTLTATNLALTLSQSYQKKVLVIDADLRRPSLHGMFGIANKEGLTTVLGAPDVHRLPVTQVHGNFWLLPAGRPDPNPMSLLTSDAMKQLLADAAAQFDWVVVDTPPVGLMADANLLAAMIDAALIVVNAGSTPYPLVQKAVDAIGPTRVLGVVLNRATRSAAVHDYDYSGYYGYSETEVVKKKRFRFR